MKITNGKDRARAIAALLLVGCATDDELAFTEQAIIDATPVGPQDLVGMVQVSGSGGTCSGMLIAADTVLTAAHCVCTTNWVSDNECDPDVLVTFRPDPVLGGRRRMHGVATAHPDYEPAWTERQVEHDLAVIRLRGVGPIFVEPFAVASTFLDEGEPAMIAGFGRTGEDCDGPSGTLNFAFDSIDTYEDGHDIAVFYDENVCHGDSGGPTLDLAGHRIHGVHSMNAWTVWHGWVTKDTTTTAHFQWIRDRTCRSPWLYECSGTEDRCTCTGTTSVVSQDTDGRVRVSLTDATGVLAMVDQGPAPIGSHLVGTGDLDGDGRDDLVWRTATADLLIWLVVGGKRVAARDAGKLDPSATIHLGDLDGDRTDDVILHRDGQLSIWPGGDAAKKLVLAHDNGKRFVGIGDFDGDGRADLVWQAPSGEVDIAGRDAGTLGPTWTPAGIGDFDGNLHADLLWRDDTGRLRIWFDGLGTSDQPEYLDEPSRDNAGKPLDPAAQLLGIADFDHDGRDDLLWFTEHGTTEVWLIDGARFIRSARLALDGTAIAGTLRARD